MSYIFGKLWHSAIIWAIRKSFQCFIQGVRFLLAKQTRLSGTYDNKSYTDVGLRNAQDVTKSQKHHRRECRHANTILFFFVVSLAVCFFSADFLGTFNFFTFRYYRPHPWLSGKWSMIGSQLNLPSNFPSQRRATTTTRATWAAL